MYIDRSCEVKTLVVQLNIKIKYPGCESRESDGYSRTNSNFGCGDHIYLFNLFIAIYM